MNATQRAQAAAEIGDVDFKVRMLIMLAVKGHCPFCLAKVDDDPIAALVRRGRVGDELRTAMQKQRARDAADGIDHESRHALDCPIVTVGAVKAVKP